MNLYQIILNIQFLPQRKHAAPPLQRPTDEHNLGKVAFIVRIIQHIQILPMGKMLKFWILTQIQYTVATVF
jgi:hypothetical protein